MELSNKSKRVFIEYLDGDDKIVQGYFDLIKQTEHHLKFKTNSNIVTLSLNRIIKIKEPIA